MYVLITAGLGATGSWNMYAKLIHWIFKGSVQRVLKEMHYKFSLLHNLGAGLSLHSFQASPTPTCELMVGSVSVSPIKQIYVCLMKIAVGMNLLLNRLFITAIVAPTSE